MCTCIFSLKTFSEYDTVLVLIVCVCNCVYKRLIRNTSYTVFTVLCIVEHFAQKYTLYDVFVLESGSVYAGTLFSVRLWATLQLFLTLRRKRPDLCRGCPRYSGPTI